MKQTLLLLLALSLFTFSHVKAQCFDYPFYQTSNTESIEINRIERNDTATLFYMDAYSRPGYWIRLSSGTTLRGNMTGKTYKLIRSQGFNLNDKVPMPASGNVSFVLQFEKTDISDTRIDFKEGNEADDFLITGISMLPRDTIGKIHCHLSGKVIDRPQSSRLVLIESGKNTSSSKFLSIPIRNGMFEYDLYCDTEMAYDLIFWDELLNGTWYTHTFFAENGLINYTFYPQEHTPRYIQQTDNPLTTEYKNFIAESEQRFSYDDLYARLDSLHQIGKYESEAAKALWAKFDSLKDNREEKDKLYKERDKLQASGKAYTPEANAILAKVEKRRNEKNSWMLERIEQNPSLVGLFILKLMCDPSRDEKDITPQIDLFRKIYTKRYPGHPYIRQMQQLEQSMQLIEGSLYPDISAPDLNGNMVRISDHTKGKIALIDLWASWCGPCRRNSIRMIPIYEKYKDRGFTIVGIAREKGSAEQMKNAIKKDGYPWLNLLELNDSGEIWYKHHIENAAGSTYLIGADGIILAINPSAEEVERILEKNL